MSFKFEDNALYFIPAHFGALSGEARGYYGDVTKIAVKYLTDRDALAALLPEPYQPADEPVVTVYSNVCKQVDFMAGRGYNIVGVDLAAVFNGKKDHVTGDYAAVLWESDTIPIIFGRESLGAPKLYADIPDALGEGDDWSFHCSLYGSRLVEGAIRNATPLPEAVLKELEQMVVDNPWMGWKYIPKADRSGPDVSYPTIIPARATIRQGWLGEGSHRFFETTLESALISHQIVEGLRTLVVKEYREAAVVRGSVDLLATESRMLE